MTVVGDSVRTVPRAFVRHAVINGLGLYVMLMYGITYYAVTTAAPRMAAEFGYPASSIFAVLTVGLLVTAALASRLGRLTDRIGASTVLLLGALLRAVLLAGMALSTEAVSFAIALLAVQILGQATEYDATFAATVQLTEEKARSGMSQITLWGGLASTAFWPATAYMLDHMSWRSMFLLYAAVVFFVCVPIAALVRAVAKERMSPRPVVHAVDASAADATSLQPATNVPFWLVAAAFALGGVSYNLPSLMLPVLEGLGLGASAIVAGALFGPSQTAGRFLDLVVGDRVSAITVAVVASAVVAVSFVVLLIGGVAAGIAFAVLFGAGAGVGYVVRGSVILALYGPVGYASWLGRLGTVRLVVTALSPLGLALMLENFGARAVVLVCGGAALLSLICFAMLATRMRKSCARRAMP